MIVEMHPHHGVDVVRIDNLFVGWGKHGTVLDGQGRGLYHVVYSTGSRVTSAVHGPLEVFASVARSRIATSTG